MKRLCLLSLILFFPTLANAQSLGLSLVGVSPTGEFSQYVNGAGGIMLDVASAADPNKTTMVFGGDIGYFIYGYKSEQVTLLMSNGDYIDATQERTNSIVTLHAFLRVIGPEAVIRPYIEMAFGASLFSTSTSIKDYYSDNEITSSWDKATLAWSAGIGGGLMFRIYTPDKPTVISSLYLDLRMRYLTGSRTSYLTENDILIDPYTGHSYFTPSQSKTDMYTFSLGVHVPFSLNSANSASNIPE